MKKSKNSSVFTSCYCISIVVTLILLYGCAGATHTKTKQDVLILTTETVVRKLVENPETGVYEMRVVSKTHTKTQTPVTENNVFIPPRPPNAHTNAHTNAGHSAQKTDDDWVFYALSLLTMVLGLYVVSN